MSRPFGVAMLFAGVDQEGPQVPQTAIPNEANLSCSAVPLGSLGNLHRLPGQVDWRGIGRRGAEPQREVQRGIRSQNASQLAAGSSLVTDSRRGRKDRARDPQAGYGGEADECQCGGMCPADAVFSLVETIADCDNHSDGGRERKANGQVRASHAGADRAPSQGNPLTRGATHVTFTLFERDKVIPITQSCLQLGKPLNKHKAEPDILPTICCAALFVITGLADNNKRLAFVNSVVTVDRKFDQ